MSVHFLKDYFLKTFNQRCILPFLIYESKTGEKLKLKKLGQGHCETQSFLCNVAIYDFHLLNNCIKF